MKSANHTAVNYDQYVEDILTPEDVHDAQRISAASSANGLFVLLALAVYFDDPADPVFPRWVGHFSLVIAAAMVPAAGAAVFQTGPLAWDGIWSFWVRNGAYAVDRKSTRLNSSH